MVISLKHKKNVSIADDPAAAAAGQVVSSNWNDEHDLTMATARLLGRVTAGAGVAEELTAAQVRSLINVTDAADPTAATINAAASKTAPADADVFGYLDSAASFGLKKFTWANLKTALNALYQPLAAKLTALAGQTWAADQITYQTGASTVGTTALTSFARTLLDDANQATAQATLGLVPGANVQAYDAATAYTNQDQTWTGAHKSGTGTVLTSGATITPTLSDWEGNRASLTLANNATLANPTDIATMVGFVGRIVCQQDATGGRTLAFGSSWFPIGASTAPSVPSGASAKFRIDFEVVNSARIDFSLSKVGA